MVLDIKTRHSHGQFKETWADIPVRQKYTINNLQISLAVSSLLVYSRNTVSDTVPGTYETVLNKIKNEACILVGRTERREGEQKQVEHIDGGMCYGEKQSSNVGEHRVWQLKIGWSGKWKSVIWAKIGKSWVCKPCGHLQKEYFSREHSKCKDFVAGAWKPLWLVKGEQWKIGRSERSNQRGQKTAKISVLLWLMWKTMASFQQGVIWSCLEGFLWLLGWEQTEHPWTETGIPLGSYSNNVGWDNNGLNQELVMEVVESVSHSLSHVQLFLTPWTVAHQAPLSMRFPRQEKKEWVAISFSRVSSQPRDWTWVIPIAEILYCLSHHGSREVVEVVASLDIF